MKKIGMESIEINFTAQYEPFIPELEDDNDLVDDSLFYDSNDNFDHETYDLTVDRTVDIILNRWDDTIYPSLKHLVTDETKCDADKINIKFDSSNELGIGFKQICFIES